MIQQLHQEKLHSARGFTGEIKGKAVTNSLLVCNIITQQLLCELQVTALSQVTLIFCTQCSPGPRVPLSLCFPKGSSLWVSHWLQSRDLCWIAARVTKKRHFAACYAVSAWKYLEGTDGNEPHAGDS